MSGHGEKLGRKQEQVIAALLRSPTISGAAEQSGISEATLFRWLQRPAFEEAYRRARQSAVDQAIAALQQATGQAVATLQEVQRDPDAPASSRVTAAKTVLEMALKLRESEELEARLSALEDKLQRMAPVAKGGRR
jgi:phosphoenolpyruvate-protein kinase (PTS system EI component)